MCAILPQTHWRRGLLRCSACSTLSGRSRSFSFRSTVINTDLADSVGRTSVCHLFGLLVSFAVCRCGESFCVVGLSVTSLQRARSLQRSHIRMDGCLAPARGAGSEGRPCRVAFLRAADCPARQPAWCSAHRSASAPPPLKRPCLPAVVLSKQAVTASTLVTNKGSSAGLS